MEKILCEHKLKFEETSFRLTISDIRKLTFDIAEKYSLPLTFKKEKGMAGRKMVLQLNEKKYKVVSA
jgi:hypothetical protein